MTTFVFDLDDTLYTLLPTFEKALRDFIPNHKYDTKAFYKIYREEGLKLYEASQSGEITQDELHCYRTIQAFERVGVVLNEEQAMTFHEFYADYKKQIELDDLTCYTLEILNKQGVKTGIITNGNTKKQSATMTSLNIEKYFDPKTIIISGDIGIEKPDVEIFKTWQRSNNVEGKIVYIGDNFEKDVIGAHNAGWIPVWFNPQENVAPEVDFEYHEIKTLPELLVLPIYEENDASNYH